MQQISQRIENEKPLKQKAVEAKGIVYTKPWVVELMLDLAGYVENTNLAEKLVVEPSAGDGAFLLSMVRRLIKSCELNRKSLKECGSAILAYELSESSAETARAAVIALLQKEGIAQLTAHKLAKSWIVVGDYLLDAPELPPADFVIGNPPYIRLEDIPESTSDEYRALYRTMKGRADIYVGFYEAALRQLKPKGSSAFICADRWMLNQYGGELRKFITSQFSVDAVIEMHNASAFEEDVNAYPAITIISRKPQGRVTVAAAGNGDMTSADAKALTSFCQLPDSKIKVSPNIKLASVDDWFHGSTPWPCGSPERLKLLRRLEEKFDSLESEKTKTKVGIGVASGLDSVFITKNATLVEKERLLPLAMAQDTTSGHLEWSKHYLVNPWNGVGLVDLDTYPRLKSYLQQHAPALKQRHTALKSVKAWYKTIDRVNSNLTGQAKLYIPDIKNRFNPVLDKGDTYPHHNLYFIQSEGWDLEVLGGLLLSRVAQLFIEMYGVKMRGGWLRFQAQYLRKIRVPNPKLIDAATAEKLRVAFRQRDYDLATEAAYELYKITKEEKRHAFGH